MRVSLGLAERFVLAMVIADKRSDTETSSLMLSQKSHAEIVSVRPSALLLSVVIANAGKHASRRIVAFFTANTLS